MDDLDSLYQIVEGLGSVKSQVVGNPENAKYPSQRTPASAADVLCIATGGPFRSTDTQVWNYKLED